MTNTATALRAPIDNVIARMEARDMSANGLAQAAGISKSIVSEARHKSGLARFEALKIDTLEKLAAPLGCTVEDLLRQSDDTAAPQPGPGLTMPGLTMPGDGQPQVALRQLMPSLLNPRKTFDHASLEELAASIAEQGLLQNLVVRPLKAEGYAIAQGGQPADTFELISGERRFRALELLARSGRWDAEAANIPVKVISADDALHIELALIENLQRQDVNPIEEAEALQQLQALDPKKWTGREIARKLGCSEGFVRQRLQLVGLSEEGKAALREEKISFTQARVIAQAPTAEIADKLLQLALKGEAPDALMPRLSRGLPDASWALFDMASAGLPTHSMDDGRVLVLDALRFKQLQIEALRKQLQKLQREWKWVDEASRFDANDYEPIRSTDKKKAGAVIELGWHFSLDDLADLSDENLNAWSGEIHIHTGLIQIEDDGGEEIRENHAATAKREAEEKLRAAKKKATNKLRRELTEGLIGRPDLAMRVLVLNLLDSTDSCLQISSLPFGVFQPGEPLEKMRPLVLGNSMHGNAYIDDKKARPADIWRGLMARSAGQIEKAIVAAAAECLNLQPHTEPSDYILLIAAELEVEVPEILRPEGQQELEQAPRAKKGGK